jgi:hypothetical protein
LRIALIELKQPRPRDVTTRRTESSGAAGHLRSVDSADALFALEGADLWVAGPEGGEGRGLGNGARSELS